MAKQDINYGSEVGDPTAESVFDSFKKSKENFDELYAADVTLTAAVDDLQLSSPEGRLPDHAKVAAG